MRIVFISLLLTLSWGALPALADRPIVADLAVRSIDIDHDFNGTEVLLFGARNDIGDIVIVVRGPKAPHVVRRKERTAGIWINKHSVTYNDVNQYYAIAATKPLEELQNNYLLQQFEIGVENLTPTTVAASEDELDFRAALARIKQEQGLYSTDVAPISFWGDTLFRTVLSFPKNLPRGTYIAEIYLFSDGQLRAVQTSPIEVRKVGFEAFMFDLAHNASWLYGLMAIVIALIAGWGASVIFRRF